MVPSTSDLSHLLYTRSDFSSILFFLCLAADKKWDKKGLLGFSICLGAILASG